MGKGSGVEVAMFRQGVYASGVLWVAASLSAEQKGFELVITYINKPL